MTSDCTVRAIQATYEAIRQVPAGAAAVRLDCGKVQQADVTFAQLIVSAQATFAGRGIPLTLDPVSACVRATFARSGIPMPAAGQAFAS